MIDSLCVTKGVCDYSRTGEIVFGKVKLPPVYVSHALAFLSKTHHPITASFLH